MSDLKGIISKAMAEGPVPQKFTCKFCNAKYMRETTLAAHMCENKRRHQQKDEVGVRLGFNAWLMFYEITQKGSGKRTMDDFIKSQFYGAFVKFGRYLHSINAINPSGFTEWLIRHNRKIDYWCKDSNYEQYLAEYLTKERPVDAIERTIVEIGKWADETDSSVPDFFRNASMFRITSMITDGKISPWVIYCSDSGADFIGNLPEEEVVKIWKWIDPSVWQKKLELYGSDAQWCKTVLADAGF